MAKLFRLRLKSKLALAMVVAALLPLALASAMAVRLAIGRLERQLASRARQTADIAVNLLLRQVQRISAEARALAASPDLQELLARRPAAVQDYLAKYRGATSWALIEVTDRRGRVVGLRRPKSLVFDGLDTGAASSGSGGVDPTLAKALDYEHYVTLRRIGRRLIVQAAAPVIDGQYALRGATLITVPLDHHMADYIKGVLRAEVGFLIGDHPLASTFFRDSGERLAGVPPPPGVVDAVRQRRQAERVWPVAGREYSLVFTRLQNVDGAQIGAMVVGLDRSELSRAQASAVQSLFLGAAVALLFAIAMALLLGGRITKPLRRLQRQTRAIAAGELERPLEAREVDDEIGELARSFNKMTDALREHQEWLNARIRELSTVHQISRAVSSVLSLDEVLRLVISEVADVLAARRAALLLADEDGGLELCDEVGLGDAPLPEKWGHIAEEVVERQSPSFDKRLLGVPLLTREHVVGVLLIGRDDSDSPFSDADMRLVTTFGGQAASAIDNARLYAEVMAFSEELEHKVEQRTAELRATNQELAHAIAELKETQAQLIHSERMAGIGGLVAGVAHEINTPAGAIQGMSQVLNDTVQRMLGRLCQLIDSDLPAGELSALLQALSEQRRDHHPEGIRPPAQVRRRARELRPRLEEQGVEDARRIARRLVEADLEPLADRVATLGRRLSPDLAVGLLEDLTFLDRSAGQIQTAIGSVVRIVRALRNYAHTDRGVVTEVDITEGLETTLTILHNELRYGISITRDFAPLPKVPVYVDELNQVWTNIIHNAVQAMGGEGELELSTFVDGDGEEVGVRITDNGPGVPADVLPRIFEPFFSTKARGEGTGLGLGIARKIVEKHGGQIAVESHPGETTFTVVLPVSGPPGTRQSTGAQPKVVAPAQATDASVE